MGLFKKNIFGQYLFLKKWIIRILGTLSHRRYRGFNELQIEGSDILRNLPDTNVLFISNHQTYFADVVAMFHVFNAALSGRDDNIINVGYLWNPKLNIYGPRSLRSTSRVASNWEAKRELCFCIHDKILLFKTKPEIIIIIINCSTTIRNVRRPVCI